VFYQQDLYSNLSIQPVFLIQSIYGIINWRNNVQEGKLKIESVSDIRIPIFAAMTISFIFLVIFNKSVSPIMDSITSSFSIVGYYLLGKRKFENWIFWMVANVIYIIMFLSQQMYLSSLLYCVFLFISVLGYIKWKKRYEKAI
jgi:nicotinamide mononucleotide transporter